jgi:hypothetical protein
MIAINCLFSYIKEKLVKALLPRQSHAKKCFEATLEVAAETEDVFVVHGWLNHHHHWILHAWCEIGEDVIDLTESREPIDKSLYYDVMGINPERSIRYTRIEFFKLASEKGHFGPFDKTFFCAETLANDPFKHIARYCASGIRDIHQKFPGGAPQPKYISSGK